MSVSALDQALGFYESIADLAAARGRPMFPQHRNAILDLKRLLAAHAPGVRWVLVGAIGVMEYLSTGRQRMTGDVDAVVEADDVRSLFEHACLEDFSFRRGRKWLSLHVELLHQPENTAVQLMHARLADIAAIFDRGRERPVLGGSVPVAAPEHLLVMKVRSYASTTRSPARRATDQADLISLLAEHPEIRAAAEEIADPNERLAIAALAREAEIERNMPDFPDGGW